MNEPACWSWPVPPLRDMAVEVDRYMELQAELELRRDDMLPRGAVEWLNRDPVTYRWMEFHTGVRIEPKAPDARCAICGRAGVYRLVDDHDHMTGLIRGLLCSSCNTSEGMRGDGAFPMYRERNPASILGYHRYYTGYGWPYGWWENPDRARSLTGNRQWTPTVGADGKTSHPHPPVDKNVTTTARPSDWLAKM